MTDGGPLRVLLADDNVDHRFLAKRALRGMQANGEVALETAADGDEALARLAREPRPHLVLLDIKMPGRDGFEVLEALRSGDLARTLVVVMLTSSENAVDVERARGMGADDYVTKPMDATAFAEAIRTVVERWRAPARARAAHA